MSESTKEKAASPGSNAARSSGEAIITAVSTVAGVACFLVAPYLHGTELLVAVSAGSLMLGAGK